MEHLECVWLLYAASLVQLSWFLITIFDSAISETKVIAAATQIISLGLKSAGYDYVNIDVNSVVFVALLFEIFYLWFIFFLPGLLG